MINYLSKFNYLSIKLITCQNKLIADQRMIDYMPVALIYSYWQMTSRRSVMGVPLTFLSAWCENTLATGQCLGSYRNSEFAYVFRGRVRFCGAQISHFKLDSGCASFSDDHVVEMVSLMTEWFDYESWTDLLYVTWSFMPHFINNSSSSIEVGRK